MLRSCLVPDEGGLLRECTSRPLDDNTGSIVTRPARLWHILAAQQLAQEATHKSITRTVGVDQLLGWDLQPHTKGVK